MNATARILTVAILAAFPIHLVAGADLTAYRWQHRPLFVFAASPLDVSYRMLNQALSRSAADIEDRDMVVFRIFEDGLSTVGDRPLTSTDASALRQRFDIPPDRFAVVLVGKDGGVKLKHTEALDLQVIFDLIDRMPMRQQEMREKNSLR